MSKDLCNGFRCKKWALMSWALVWQVAGWQCHAIPYLLPLQTSLHHITSFFAWRTSQINLHPQFTFLTTAPPFGQAAQAQPFEYLTGSHSPVTPHHTRYMTPGTLYNHSWQVIVARNLVFCEMKKKAVCHACRVCRIGIWSLMIATSVGKSTFLVQPKTIRFPF